MTVVFHLDTPKKVLPLLRSGPKRVLALQSEVLFVVGFFLFFLLVLCECPVLAQA